MKRGGARARSSDYTRNVYRELHAEADELANRHTDEISYEENLGSGGFAFSLTVANGGALLGLDGRHS